MIVLKSLTNNLKRTLTTMTQISQEEWINQCRRIVPQMTDNMHKGEAGRIGIIGGSFEYTGAPYYAGMAALKVGCDLVHVICPQNAALPIKSYSPELIVHPLLDCENAFELIEPWLSRLHVLVIGSGLGRERKILDTVSEIILACKKTHKPLVIDADGLFLITQNVSLIQNYKNVILTPNAMELFRLIGDSDDKMLALVEKLGNHCVVLEKAMKDRIYDLKNLSKLECPIGGSNRRCGGQGDLLAGAIATFYHWALNLSDHESGDLDLYGVNPAVLACYAGSFLIKYSNKLGYEKLGRSMTALDMISMIHPAFVEHFEIEKSKK